MKLLYWSIILVANVSSQIHEDTSINVSHTFELQRTNASFKEQEKSKNPSYISKSNKNVSVFGNKTRGHLAKQDYISRTNNKRKPSIYSQTEDYRINEIENEYVPSLMNEMLKKHEHNDLCKPSGRQNISVRNAFNKGKVLYSEGSLTILRLHYSLDLNSLKEENLTYAGVYVSPGHLRSHHWKKRFSGSFFHYSLYRVRTKVRNTLPDHLQSLFRFGNRSGVIPLKESLKILSKLEQIFGKSVACRTVSYNYDATTQSERSLDVTELARRWRQEPSRHKHAPFQLLLAITEFKHSTFVQHLLWSEIEMQCFQPSQATLVEVSFQCVSSHPNTSGGKMHRQKRHMNPSPKGNLKIFGSLQLPKSFSKRSLRSNVCQRESMWVDFKDLGWSDWVIAPRSFQAYRCVGECPYPLSGRLNSTNYAMLASMMNSVDPQNSPMPCCVPTSLGAISVLYLDNSDNVVLRNYEGMVVEGCGCR